MPPAHCTSGSTITAAASSACRASSSRIGSKRRRERSSPALAGLAVVAVGRGRRDHIHQQRRVDLLVERDIADGQRAQRLAVIAVGERDEPLLRGLADIAPVVEAHLHGDFHRGRAVVGEEAARETRRRQAQSATPPDRSPARCVNPAKITCSSSSSCAAHRGADARVGVAEQVHPPGADGIEIAAAVHGLQPHAVAADGWGSAACPARDPSSACRGARHARGRARRGAEDRVVEGGHAGIIMQYAAGLRGAS